MNGLLIKEASISYKMCKSMFFVEALFLVVSIFAGKNVFFMAYPSLCAGMLPYTLLSIDESYGWDKFAGTLPCSRAQLVSSKYILCLINIAIVVLAAALIQSCKMISDGVFSIGSLLSLILFFVSTGLISCSVITPVVFKFGPQKGRIIFIAMIAIVTAFSTKLITNSSMERSAFLSVLPANAAIFIFDALILTVSWLLSIHFYKQKEF